MDQLSSLFVHGGRRSSERIKGWSAIRCFRLSFARLRSKRENELDSEASRCLRVFDWLPPQPDQIHQPPVTSKSNCDLRVNEMTLQLCDHGSAQLNTGRLVASSRHCCTALADERCPTIVVAEVRSSTKYPKRYRSKQVVAEEVPRSQLWRKFYEGLRRRGDLTVWFDEEGNRELEGRQDR